MGLFDRLFGKRRPELPPPPPPAPEDAFPALRPTAAAGELIPCDDIEWNQAEQLRFLDETLRGPAVDGLVDTLGRPEFNGNAQCRPRNAAVLYAMVAAHEPSRIMEIGCGWSTWVIRAAKNQAMTPGELITVDPEPAIDLIELSDAHLDKALVDVPVDDFRIMMAGEMLVVDLDSLRARPGDVDYLFREVLPALVPGVIVGLMGVRLPRELSERDLMAGPSPHRPLLAYLRSARPQILFAGAWLEETLPERLEESLAPLTGGDTNPCTALWFVTR